MAVRGRTLQWREAWSLGEICRGNPLLARALSLTLHALLGFMGGCVTLFAGSAPFGMAMTARAGGGAAGIACMLGAMAGYFVTLGVGQGVRYAAALMLIYTAAFVFRENGVSRRRWFMPLLAGAASALTGAVSLFGAGNTLLIASELASEALLTGLGAYFFTLALEETRAENETAELRRTAGGILLACVAVMAVTELRLFGLLSPGRLLASGAALVCAFGGGAAVGAAAGVTLGTAVCLSGGSSAALALCFGFAGLMAGALNRRGRVAAALSWCLSFAIIALWSWRSIGETGVLLEMLGGAAGFLLIPAEMLADLTARLRTAGGAGETGLRRYTARRTRELASAFRELYETVRRSAEDESSNMDVAAVYDRAAETVCAACPKKGECWHTGYMDTLTILNDATSALTGRGRLLPGDLPERFRERCPSAESFMEAVNAELRAMTYRRRLRARLEENRTAAYGQYKYLAGVLDAVAEDLRCAMGPDERAERRLLRYLNSLEMDAEAAVFRDQSGRLRVVLESAQLDILDRTPGSMDRLSQLLGVRLCRPVSANTEPGRLVLLEAEPLAVSVGVAAMKKEGESVSGDRGTYFKTDQGVLCVLLSDGMGSGESAARESVSAVRILEKFLRAGVEPATAMKLLNSVMLLKNGENWGYATVDLMCVDLFTGQTGFYKYGAAPSYIRTGHAVRRVKGISLAAGILAGEGETPDVVRMDLKSGSLALVASDGVISGTNDNWLREMLGSYEGTDMRELSRQVLRQAVKRGGCTDDMTVLAVRVEDRK